MAGDGLEIKVAEAGPQDGAGFAALQEGLDRHARTFLPGGRKTVGVFARDGGGRLAGGARGTVAGRVFLVRELWVDESGRGRGTGRRIMQACEADALRRGCSRIAVDTMSYQAPDFYRKLGYEVKAVVPDFYEGHDRIFFEKKIGEAA